MADEFETRTYDQLPRATAVSPDALMAFQEEGAPLAAIELKKLLGRLISTNAAFEEEAAPDGIQGDLDHDENSIGLVYADPVPAKNGWYRKTGASGSGGWSQFEKLSDFAAAEVQSLVDEARAYAETTASSTQGSFRELGTVSLSGYPTPFPAHSGYAGAGHYVWEIPQSKRGKALGIKFKCGQAGSFEFGFYTRDPDGVTDRTRHITIEADAAGTIHVPFVLDKEAGEFPGVKVTGNCLVYGAGADPSGGWYSGANIPFTDVSKTANLPIFVEFEIVEIDVIEKLDARTTKIESDFYETLTATYGLAAPIADQAVSLDNSYYVVPLPNIRDEYVKRVPVNFKVDGTLTIYAFSGGASKSPVRTLGPLAVTAGAHEIVIDPPLLIEEGQHFGFRAPGLGTSSGVAGGLALLGSAALPVTAINPIANVRAGIGYETEFKSPVFSGGGAGTGRPMGIDLPWDNMLSVTMGQSLAEGSRAPGNPGYAPITTLQEYDTVCLPAYPAAPDVLLPATVANSERKTNSDIPGVYLRGEWSGLGAARQLRDALARDHNVTHLTLPNRIVIVNNGIGSKRIDQIAKDTPAFNAAITQASSLATVAGASAGVISVHFGQGESDGALYADTGYEVYKGRLKTFAKDIDAGLRAATGQKRRVPTIAYQVSSKGGWEIANAQLDASIESDLIFIACPMYQFTYYDQLHIGAPSERHLGGYYGEADAAWLRGEKWEPLRPTALGMSAETATFTFNKGGLVLDTALVPAQPGYGFSAVAADGVTPVAVTGAALLGGNRLRLVFEAPLTTGAQIFYGKPAAVGMAPFDGGAGNLRDSAGDSKKIDGLPLHNWLVLFGWTV